MAKKTFNPLIQTATDYTKFKTLRGNRDVNPNHLRRLKISMNDNYLFSPIIVNDRMEVIDGQHRLRVCRELGLPVYYIIVYGYGVKEVQILNANTSNWKKSDYLDGYIKDGREAYIKFKEFQNEFPSLSFSSCIKILSGIRGNADNKGGGSRKEGQTHIVMKNFERGNFDIPDMKKSYEVARMIMQYKEVYDNYNDNTFIITLLGLFENPNFNHEQMLYKLKIQPNELVKCKSVKDYIVRLEDIYNYKSRNKISLRYNQ